MRASPRSGRRRSRSEPPGRGGFAKPRVGPVGAGVLAVLAGFPVLAQVGAFPPTGPAQEESLPSAETEPAPAAAPPPAESASPFGLSPDVFPGIFGGRPAPGGAPAEPASPFGISPDIFPGILGGRPDRRILEQPAVPSETGEPDLSTGAGRRAVGGGAGTGSGASDRARARLCGRAGFHVPGLPDAPLRVRQSRAFAVAAAEPGSARRRRRTRPRRLRSRRCVPERFRFRPMIFALPPILIQPSVSVIGGYTDNPRGTPNNFSDVFGRFHGATAISVDTVRLQGQLNGSLDYLKYARATDEDRAIGNLLAYGLGTVVTDHLFIDGRAAITDTSRTGGFAFAGPSAHPELAGAQRSQTSVTPIARQSFSGYVDSELRYNFSTTQSTSGSLFGNVKCIPIDRAEFAKRYAKRRDRDILDRPAVHGFRFEIDARCAENRLQTRLPNRRSIGRSTTCRTSSTRSLPGLPGSGTRTSTIRCSQAPASTGQAGTLAVVTRRLRDSYLLLTYGRQEGLLGFNGALQYEITQRTVAFASFQRNRISQQQQNL